jgi:hypothetical protein
LLKNLLCGLPLLLPQKIKGQILSSTNHGIFKSMPTFPACSPLAEKDSPTKRAGKNQRKKIQPEALHLSYYSINQ